jgi:glycosyltransferase involved in cell wall biosynthesis
MLIKHLKSIFGANGGRRFAGTGIDKRPTTGYFGCIDVVGANEGILGWVIDAANPGKAQTILVMVGGQVIGSTIAEGRRSDVAKYFGAHTVCAFQFKWDQAYQVPEVASAAGEHLALSIVGTNVFLTLPANMPSTQQVLSWIPAGSRVLHAFEDSEKIEVETDAESDDLRNVPVEKKDKSEVFDRDFYLTMNPDVLNAGADPLTHFQQVGWKEGRDPNPYFSTRFYLETSPDVRDAGINPFEHYANAGRLEGRLGKRPGGYKAEVLSSLVSLNQTVKDWTRKDDVTLVPASEVQEHLRKASRGRVNGIVVALSHDDYTKNIGGIQLCLALEQGAFARNDCCYIQIFPWQPLPVLSTRSESDTVVSFSIDGRSVGSCWSRDLLSALKSVTESTKGGANSLIVHALHGHSVDFVIALNKQLAPRKAYFWLHDYFSVCTGFNLLRNCVSYCGAPPETSQACAVCVYGESRPAHVGAIQRLFAAISFTVVGPSKFVSALWKQTVSLSHADLVSHEHCDFIEEGSRVDFPELKIATKKLRLPRRLKIAFLGQPVSHKGWPVFRDLVLQQCANPNYEFVHLGTHPDPSLPVHFREVRVTPEKTDAMVEALKLEKIDAVVQWSVWPETFCITAHEALAAGAVIITSKASGNIPCLVEKVGTGLVFDNEQHLWDAFASNEVARYVAQRKQKGIPCGKLKFSGMTADLACGKPTTSVVTAPKAKSATAPR